MIGIGPMKTTPPYLLWLFVLLTSVEMKKKDMKDEMIKSMPKPKIHPPPYMIGMNTKRAIDASPLSTDAATRSKPSANSIRGNIFLFIRTISTKKLLIISPTC